MRLNMANFGPSNLSNNTYMKKLRRATGRWIRWVRQSVRLINGERYSLYQVHWHSPSEITVDGISFHLKRILSISSTMLPFMARTTALLRLVCSTNLGNAINPLTISGQNCCVGQLGGGFAGFGKRLRHDQWWTLHLLPGALAFALREHGRWNSGDERHASLFRTSIGPQHQADKGTFQSGYYH